MPTVKAGDLNIYYERAGSGPRLLFISGSGGDLRSKPNVMDGPLPKHFDTLAYDQRGLGQTSKPNHPYTMADYADDAVALMKAIGWGSALVIGASFGGMVALELAIRHPHVVEGLVLCCTSPGGAGGASYPLHELLHLDREARARHLISIIDTRRDAEWQKTHPKEYEQLVAFAANDPYADEPDREMGYRRQLEARAHHDTWDRLGNIKCPTLICAGKYDGQATPETQEKMVSRIKGAQLCFFEGGHYFMVQDRTAFPAMIGFLGGSRNLDSAKGEG